MQVFSGSYFIYKVTVYMAMKSLSHVIFLLSISLSKGCFEAIEKRCLRSIVIGLYEKDGDELCKEPFESYQFNYSYKSSSSSNRLVKLSFCLHRFNLFCLQYYQCKYSSAHITSVQEASSKLEKIEEIVQGQAVLFEFQTLLLR